MAKRITSGDYVGHLVRVLGKITTRGGHVIEAGEVCYCSHHWRGKLMLEHAITGKIRVRGASIFDVHRVLPTVRISAASALLNQLERMRSCNRPANHYEQLRAAKKELREAMREAGVPLTLEPAHGGKDAPRA